MFRAWGLLAVAACASSASAAFISVGQYRLHNHPDGTANPPPYGLRLDELFNATSGSDDFTFNFDHPQSAMFLDYTGSSIHIYGQSWGGRDVGSTYANDQYQGLYLIDFTYAVGVQMVPMDDDIYVELPSYQRNTGSITVPTSAGGAVIPLYDGHYDSNVLDFRFGDESNNQGHRGYSGLSGWGWMFHGSPDAPYHENSDWIFTAIPVPTPGAVVVLGLAGMRIAVRRRRTA